MVDDNEAELKRLRAETEQLRSTLKGRDVEVATLKTELEKLARLRMEEEGKLAAREAAGKFMRKGSSMRVLFPFTAIVRQDLMRTAMVLNAINPDIGGVLIKGEKGTGKSVSVRGLAEVLPEIDAVEGCRFNCDPKELTRLCPECVVKRDKGILKTIRRPIKVVDLPLNTTEDRLMGSIDIEKVLGEGTKAFEPGILAEVHRGILYVDEINLLDDYVVDVLLDAAASGTVTVEREGISVSHPSKFIIVGSMNPEEGELRPQLLDRLALQVEVGGIDSIEDRMEIVRRREEFTRDPLGLRRRFEPDQEGLRQRIVKARQLIPRVETPLSLKAVIARLSLAFKVHGHRSDIIIERTARANAAFEGRTEVNPMDVEVAGLLSLPHRARLPSAEKARWGRELVKEKLSRIQEEAP
jgi:magnesium chelatase subunit I